MKKKLEWLRARIAKGMEDIENGRLIDDSEEINQKVHDRQDPAIEEW